MVQVRPVRPVAAGRERQRLSQARPDRPAEGRVMRVIVSGAVHARLYSGDFLSKR